MLQNLMGKAQMIFSSVASRNHDYIIEREESQTEFYRWMHKRYGSGAFDLLLKNASYQIPEMGTHQGAWSYDLATVKGLHFTDLAVVVEFVSTSTQSKATLKSVSFLVRRGVGYDFISEQVFLEQMKPYVDLKA